MTYATSDLCDQFSDRVRVLEPIFHDKGDATRFHGEVVTLKVFEDNVLVRHVLEQEGNGRVLVVDGGGSIRCALLGDRLAQLASDNRWNGVVLYGCIRDVEEVAKIPVGIKALNASPLKSMKRGEGEQNPQVHFAGTTINPGDYLYADADGIVIASKELGS